MTSATVAVATRSCSPAITLRLTGELDLATAPKCEREVSTAIQSIEPPALIVLDLDALQFLGCAGITMLLTVRQLCHQQGLDFCLVVQAARQIKRLLTLTGVTAELPIYSSVEQAEAMHRR